MKTDQFRMAQWLAAAIVVYALAYFTPIATVQTAFWKVGHETLGAWVGYVISRTAVPQLRVHLVFEATMQAFARYQADPSVHGSLAALASVGVLAVAVLFRAVCMGAAILAMSMGL